MRSSNWTNKLYNIKQEVALKLMSLKALRCRPSKARSEVFFLVSIYFFFSFYTRLGEHKCNVSFGNSLFNNNNFQ